MIVTPYLWQSLAVLAGILVTFVVMWAMKLHQDGKPPRTWNK